LSPIHKLPERDIRIFAAILKKRYDMLNMMQGEDFADKYLLCTKNREDIIKEYNISDNIFRNCLCRLRKVGILDEHDIINKKYIPNISDDKSDFHQVYINFSIQEQE
jgi:hypothetical protein